MKLAAAPLLLLLACVGTAHAQGLLGSRLSTLRCGGVTPAPIPSAVLKAVGVNGAIEISWPPALCADKFAVTVTRTDLAETNVR